MKLSFTNGKGLWQWWIQDALGAKPKSYYGGKVGTFDVAFAMLMTVFAVVVGFFVSLILLAFVIETKGIGLLIVALVGGAVYGLYKLIHNTAGKNA